jgi:inner membrane protease ATP23
VDKALGSGERSDSREGGSLTVRADLYVRWLMQALTNSGCSVSRSFFRCAPCDVAATGFYQVRGGITMCQNGYDHFSDDQIARVMRHELTHAFDFCRADVNVNNCLHVACTEIRASMLSGECSLGSEVLRLEVPPVGVARHFRSCVRRRALLSISSLPHCKTSAEKAIDAAWNRCFNDKEPFDHRP